MNVAERLLVHAQAQYQPALSMSGSDTLCLLQHKILEPIL